MVIYPKWSKMASGQLLFLTLLVLLNHKGGGHGLLVRLAVVHGVCMSIN